MGELNMSKRIKVILIILICAIFLVPVPTRYKDGGTVTYTAISYSVRKQHSLSLSGQGYDVGTQVRLLFWTVYDDVKYDPNAG